MPATDAMVDRAIALLRSLHADIAECRVSGHEFDVDNTRFEWPNLAILADEIEAFLRSADRDTR
jgi:hypothetical protein